MKLKLASVLLGLLASIAHTPAMATEGALGRSITGAQITPYVGLIPPTPGFQLSFSFVNYSGDIGGSKQVPIAGSEALNLHADVDLLAATAAYIWDTKPGRWNFASMLTIPGISSDVRADLSLGGLGGRTSDSSSGLYDLYFAPVIASYHVSEVEHWSFGLYIYAPTADYNKNQLANNGLNIWTFTPAAGYTHLFQKGTLELSALAGVDFYTKNTATDYSNGSVFHLDGLLMKRTSSGWGFGLAGGWIQQIDDDTGTLAQKLNGFKGHSLGLGPAIDFTKSWSKEDRISITLRWLKEFDVKNRIEGEPLVLNVGISL
jgi:hypothetical protein